MEKLVLTFLFSLLISSCNSDEKEFKLKQGDLLFQNSGRSEIATAIKDVTGTSFSKNYSHVGMAVQKKWAMVCFRGNSKGRSLPNSDKKVFEQK